MQDKNASLAVGVYGDDIPSVQTLSLKHQKYEADVAHLEDKAAALRHRADLLSKSHPDSVDEIWEKQNLVDDRAGRLKDKCRNHRDKMNENYDFVKFKQERDDANAFITTMNELLANQELANDVHTAEAHLDRHRDLQAEIDARTPQILKLEDFIDNLRDHPAIEDIEQMIQQLKDMLQKLKEDFNEREDLLQKNVDFTRVDREYDQLMQWIHGKDESLKDESSLPNKHEDIDRMVNNQENKIIQALTAIQDMMSQDFKAPELEKKEKHLQTSWVELRAKLFAKRDEMIHDKSVVSTIGDAEEIENWIAERIPQAEDTSIEDKATIQRKNEKQKAFDAEVLANQDRIDAFTTLVSAKLDSKKTTEEQKQILQEKLRKITESFSYLVQVTKTKTATLKRANRQRLYYTAYRDFEFWLTHVEAQFGQTDCGRDLKTVTHERKKHEYFEEDVEIHSQRLKDLNDLAQECIESKQFDPDEIISKRENVNGRFEKVESFTKDRRVKLDEAYTFFKILSQITMEETWLKEKTILLASIDFGRDLPQTENLMKKHKRLIQETENHADEIEKVRPVIEDILAEKKFGHESVGGRYQTLEEFWHQFAEHVKERQQRLEQSKAFHELVRDVDEVRMWVSEKRALMHEPDYGDTLAAVQSLIRKHRAFANHIHLHEEKANLLLSRGNKLLNEGNLNKNALLHSLELLQTELKNLRQLYATRSEKLAENYAYLQFTWKTDVIESWINEKKLIIESDEVWTAIRDMSDVLDLTHRHDTFEAALQGFEDDNITTITRLHNQLTEADHAQMEKISHCYRALADRWAALRAVSRKRKEQLEARREFFQSIEDKFLLFAKKASNFNSWFENSEEDLTDPVKCNSVEEVQALQHAHGEFMRSLKLAEEDLLELKQLDADINQKRRLDNPYTWFTIGALEENWIGLLERVQARKTELDGELMSQQYKEELRKTFAKEANAFYDWLINARDRVMDEDGTLDHQLEDLRKLSLEVKKQRGKLRIIEEIAQKMRDRMILDNRHTEHSPVALHQQWDQLDQLCQRMQQNLEQQLTAKETSGVTETQLSDFTKMFRYHDKDRLGRLNHEDLKTCLRAIGYDLPMVEEGVEDPDFEAILDVMDRERKGYVLLGDYMHYLMMRETDVVGSREEIEDAFLTLAGQGRAYLTAAEIRRQLEPEVAEYCIANMKPYVDGEGFSVDGGLDFLEFCQRVFAK